MRRPLLLVGVVALGVLTGLVTPSGAAADPIPDEARWIGVVSAVRTMPGSAYKEEIDLVKTDPTTSAGSATGTFYKDWGGQCSDGNGTYYDWHGVQSASGAYHGIYGGGGSPTLTQLEENIMFSAQPDWSTMTIEWDQNARVFYEHLKGSSNVTGAVTVDTVTWDLKRVHLGNDFLLAIDDVAWTHPGIPVQVPVLANDLVPPGEIATVQSATGGQDGTITSGIAGVTYTPDIGFTGDDSFSYTIASSGRGTSTASVSVSVGNRPPDAVDDTAQADDFGIARVPVLANDSDPDGDPISLAVYGQGDHGTVARDGDTLVYTQSPGAAAPNGQDVFTYTIWDTFGAASTATVTIGAPALVPCPPLTLTGTASSTFGSRDVTWRVTGVVGAGAIRGTLTSPGVAPVAVTGTDVVTVSYPSFGEKPGTLTLTRPCQGTVTGLGVADPVTTYAPSVAFAKGETYFPDSVQPFLDNALLIADRPLGSKTLLSDPRCPDLVVAKGRAVTNTRLKSMLTARPGPELVPKSLPRLNVGRLGGKGSKAYSSVEYQAYPVRRPNRCRAAGTSTATAAGALKKNPNDTGLVLSTTGAPPPLPKGSTARAPFYVHYVSGHYIAYWFFYPANVWRENRITELHEGDWERTLINIDPSGLLAGTPNIPGGRTPSARVAGFFQHYCKADTRMLQELTFDRGTLASPAPPDTHVIVYSAKGGHASYHKSQARVVLSCAGQWPPGQGHGDEPSGKTPTWRPWTRPGGLVDATTQPWWGFRGAWGDPGPGNATFLSYGPQAPGGQADGAPSGW